MRHRFAAALLALTLGPALAPIAAGDEPKGRLARSQSPYLREAADHPIAWFAWGKEPFELARALDRPILLDIGASWCRFCRLMETETYGHPDIVATVNSHFVAIKVDRDERPDVDRRYQDAVNALSGSGGWPLTVFLTPEGRPFFGGSYFPPEDQGGQPGLKGVLERVLEIHSKQKDAILDGADELQERLTAWDESLSRRGTLSESLLNSLGAELKREFDEEFGGFGTADAPKHLLTAPVEFAIAQGFEKKDGRLSAIATRTLKAAAAGGIHDAVGGGFHRYSVGRDWRVPRFEKIAADNAAILLAAAHAFGASGGDPVFEEIVRDTVRYFESTLADRERGGVYASQAAEATPGDEGAYYTWTKKEIEDALIETSEEHRVFTALYSVAVMPRHLDSHPDRNVLARVATEAEVARRFGLDPAHVAATVRSALAKLETVRMKRPAPPVDTTLYVATNGLAAWALFEAAALLSREDLRDFAKRTLERCLREGSDKRGGLLHAIPAPGATPVVGFLDDHVAMAMACLAAHEATGDAAWIRESRRLIDVALARFEDRERGGFYDTETRPEGADPSLPERHRGFGDEPHPGSNPFAALVLLRVATVTGDETYREKARRTLESFAGSLTLYGHSAGTYGLALRELLAPPPHVVIVGDPAAPATDALRRAALGTYRAGRRVTVHAPDARPPYPASPDGDPVAYVCAGGSCSPPASDPAALRETLTTFGRKPDRRP